MFRFQFYDDAGARVREDVEQVCRLVTAQDKARLVLDERGYARAEIFRDGVHMASLSRFLGADEH